jgi:hypothetical protein
MGDVLLIGKSADGSVNVLNGDTHSYLNVKDISRSIGTNSTLEIFAMTR